VTEVQGSAGERAAVAISGKLSDLCESCRKLSRLRRFELRGCGTLVEDFQHIVAGVGIGQDVGMVRVAGTEDGEVGDRVAGVAKQVQEGLGFVIVFG